MQSEQSIHTEKKSIMITDAPTVPQMSESWPKWMAHHETKPAGLLTAEDGSSNSENEHVVQIRQSVDMLAITDTCLSMSTSENNEQDERVQLTSLLDQANTPGDIKSSDGISFDPHSEVVNRASGAVTKKPTIGFVPQKGTTTKACILEKTLKIVAKGPNIIGGEDSTYEASSPATGPPPPPPTPNVLTINNIKEHGFLQSISQSSIKSEEPSLTSATPAAWLAETLQSAKHPHKTMTQCNFSNLFSAECNPHVYNTSDSITKHQIMYGWSSQHGHDDVHGNVNDSSSISTIPVHKSGCSDSCSSPPTKYCNVVQMPGSSVNENAPQVTLSAAPSAVVSPSVGAMPCVGVGQSPSTTAAGEASMSAASGSSTAGAHSPLCGSNQGCCVDISCQSTGSGSVSCDGCGGCDSRSCDSNSSGGGSLAARGGNDMSERHNIILPEAGAGEADAQQHLHRVSNHNAKTGLTHNWQATLTTVKER